MKKLIYSLFAFVALALTNTSCSDNLENGASANGNEVAVSFKVELENAVGSRAIGDGTNAKYLAFAVYKEAVNDTIDNEVEALRQDNIEVDSETLTATVTTRLVKGQTYNFIFWAQNEKTKTGTDAAPVYKGTYYDVKDLRNIEVLYGTNNSIAANDEKRDAFYAVEKELKITGPINETITLKRPFAQVNVGTKIGSLAEAATAETTITQSKMVIKGVASKLHPYSGKVSEAKDVTYTLANIPESNHTDLAGDLKDVKDVDYEYLSMNYILVNDQDPGTANKIDGTKKGLVNATFEVWEANATKAVNTFEIPNVPVQRNWRTNIIGDILSENVTFNIVIDPKFDTDKNGEDHNYELAKELAYAFANGGEVTLDKDVETSHTMEVAEGKNVVLNLNGKTINNKNIKATTENPTPNYDVIIVRKDATLTINGEGVIEALTGNDGYAVIVEGTLIINGGTFKAGIDENGEANAVIYARGNGKIIVNGGTFPNGASSGFVLNKKDADRATTTIEVTGGTFTGFNPGNNAAEGAGTNFLAKGYKAENIGTAAAPIYQVVVDPTADADGNLALTNNGLLMNTVNVNNGVMDGHGFTLTVSENLTSNHLVKGKGDATIKNLTIEGDGEYYDTDKSTRALYFDGALGDVTVSNVHVSGVGYALNVNTSTKATGALTVSNSTLEGWTSFSGVFTAVTFKNVHFGISSYFEGSSYDAWYHGGIRPYQSATLENCTFDQDFYLCLTELGTGAITLKNCKVGDQTITDGNIENLLKFEGTAIVGKNVIISNN